MSSDNSGNGTTIHLATGIGGVGVNIVISTWIMWTIALVFVALRFYTRTRLVRVLGASDWVSAASLLAALAMCISKVLECAHGTGRHKWDIDVNAEMKDFLQAWWFTLFTYQLSLALTKASVCLLYLTIFTFAWARKATYAVLIFVVVSSLWCLASLLTACIPLQAFWDSTVKASFCQSGIVWWTITGLPIATDVLVCIIPIPMVIRLKLPRRQKALVVSIFTMGFLVCLISFVRLAITIHSARQPDPDFTYARKDISYWTIIEVHAAISITSIMTLKPLILKLWPSLLRTQNPDTSSYINDSNPPLTIGSKPSRSNMNIARPESWFDGPANADANIVMTDLEARARARARARAEVASAEDEDQENDQNDHDYEAEHYSVMTESRTNSGLTDRLDTAATTQSMA
ncbi:hypothetical protein B0T24DRAFT_143293 [Lasiosphaeria ovina]|uniref:Rhodopsin domain-containing protein n=1 Tax=Lasiosphaeria ovina TaxID=92902 RepID=A0AAE0NCS6_9PEZI|nr:hypothetical protein B0T24DRAFT_143293 [Lasiosphaeria ovina]